MGKMMHSAQRAAFSILVDKAMDKINEDRETSFLKMVDLTESFAKDRFTLQQYDAARELIKDQDGKWMKYTNRVLDEVSPNVIKTTALNLGFESMLYGVKMKEESKKKYECNIPWLILMDPTSACNLHCTGCWAAEYGQKLNLSYEDLDRIITQGKELGVYFYMYGVW